MPELKSELKSSLLKPPVATLSASTYQAAQKSEVQFSTKPIKKQAVQTPAHSLKSVFLDSKLLEVTKAIQRQQGSS